MFKLNKKHFYIIEAIGMDDPQRELLKAKLKARKIECEVIGYQLEVYEMEKNE